MQLNSDVGIRQYAQAQTVQNAKTTTATANVAAQKEGAESVAAKTTSPDLDKAEFSSTRDVMKMSDSERASLVSSLKEDLDNQMNRFTSMMMQTFNKQGITSVTANSDDFWKMMASGNFTVDAKTKAEAQAAISEDGFWGVKQTSQRIFDFAAALAGDDVEKMKEMHAAVEKGFQQATGAWGKELPSICGDTHAAVTQLFDEYYAQREAA